MKDLATQIEINNKTMLVLFDERKEMILKLMAMVEEIHKIAVTQQEQNLILKAEIMRLRAKKGKKMLNAPQEHNHAVDHGLSLPCQI